MPVSAADVQVSLMQGRRARLRRERQNRGGDAEDDEDAKEQTRVAAIMASLEAQQNTERDNARGTADQRRQEEVSNKRRRYSSCGNDQQGLIDDIFKRDWEREYERDEIKRKQAMGQQPSFLYICYRV